MYKRQRYAKVMDKKGRGMLFFGDELSFSAQAGSYTFEEGVELEIYSSKSSYYDLSLIHIFHCLAELAPQDVEDLWHTQELVVGVCELEPQRLAALGGAAEEGFVFRARFRAAHQMCIRDRAYAPRMAGGPVRR